MRIGPKADDSGIRDETALLMTERRATVLPQVLAARAGPEFTDLALQARTLFWSFQKHFQRLHLLVAETQAGCDTV